MSFLVIADLEMLVCDRTHLDAYDDDEFKTRILMLTGECDKWAIENEGKWLFSQELEGMFFSTYPWDGSVAENIDLGSIFWPWLGKIKREDVLINLSHSFILDPNLHATYVSRDYPEADQVWRCTLARHQDIPANQTLIFSSPGKVDQVSLTETTNSIPPQDFAVVKDATERLSILKKHDPWLRYGLPKVGEVPYIPPDPTASDFPRVFCPPRNRTGFQDTRDRIWVEDEERGQKHWDVQQKPYRRGNYIRVTPDGRRLD